MRIFIGYGYNQRDQWIQTDVYPILKAIGIDIVDGKDMYGEELGDGVKERIEQSDALIGFSTLREGEENAAFNTHVWVRDEMNCALGMGKAVVEVRESGVKNPPGMIGERQRIALDPTNRLACIAELVGVVQSWSMRKLQIAPLDQKIAREITQALTREELIIEYRCRFNGRDSKYRSGRMELVNRGLFLTATGLPDGSLVQIKGSVRGGGTLFDTGFHNSDVVRIEF